MTKFDVAMAFVLKWEGGYVNDPDDPGGETRFGISKRAHPDVDIRGLTEETAKAIYRDEYWRKIRAASLPPSVALALVDYAVNSGVSQASKALQRVVGMGSADIDGQIGPYTLSQVDTYLQDFGEKALAVAVVRDRVEFLTGLVKRNPERVKYLHGWMRRTHACLVEVC